MATVEEFINNRIGALERSGIAGPDAKSRIEQLLLDRGMPLADYESGKMKREKFFATEVPPTVEEHINGLIGEGKTKPEIQRDMAERGYYDTDRSIKQNFGSVLPPKLESSDHRRTMEGYSLLGVPLWPKWEDKLKSGGFEGRDPYEIPSLRLQRRRLEAIKAGLSRDQTDETLEYLDYLNKKHELEKSGEWGITASSLKLLKEIKGGAPEVSEEAKKRAEETFQLKQDLRLKRFVGTGTGVFAAAARGVDSVLGTSIIPKDEKGTRYHRVPIVNEKGIIKKDAQGKNKYRLVESPEEVLKINQEDMFRVQRESLDRLIHLRNTANLSAPGKMREEVVDTAQGVAEMVHMFVPLLESLDAGALAILEQANADPNFDFDKAMFEQSLIGFESGKQFPIGISAYLSPIMNSLAVATGRGDTEQLTEDETQRAEFFGTGIVLPWTKQLSGQATAMPLETLFASIPVLNLLKGLGSAAAGSRLNHAIKGMKANGVPEAEIAKQMKIRLDKAMSDSQKSYMRRIIESSAGQKIEKALLGREGVLGPVADVVSQAGLGLALGGTFAGAESALFEAGLAGGVLGTSATIGQLIKKFPRARRWFTPEVWASNSPYHEASGRAFASEVTDAQNVADAWSLLVERQARRGETPSDEGLWSINPEELPAYISDNVARINAKIDLDPKVKEAQAIVNQLEPGTENYVNAKAILDEQRRDLFIELAEESPQIWRAHNYYKELTSINRKRLEVRDRFDEGAAAIDERFNKELEAATARFRKEESPERVAAEAFKLEEEGLKREHKNLENAEQRKQQANDARDNALKVLHMSRKSRVREAEMRLAAAKKRYRKALDDKADLDTQDRLKAEVQRLTDEKKRIDSTSEAGRNIDEEMIRIENEHKRAVHEIDEERAALDLVGEEERINANINRLAAEVRRAELNDADALARGDMDLETFKEIQAARGSALLEKVTEEKAAAMAKLETRRHERMQKFDDREKDIMDMLRDEYKTTIQLRDGMPIADPLIKKRRHHVLLQDGSFEAVIKEQIPDSVGRNSESRPGVVETVTYEDPSSKAATTGQQILNLPVDQQLDVVSIIEKLAKGLTEGIIKLETGGKVGGSQNVAYRFIRDSLSRVLFDDTSPKLLKSPVMRDKFKHFLADRLSSEYGVPIDKNLIAKIEKLVNDMASPRAAGDAIYVEVGYTFYRKSGDGVRPLFSIEDAFSEFAQTKLSKRQLRRSMIEAVQVELPILRQRIGANVAVNTMLKRSGTNLTDFMRGVFRKDGTANEPYLRSIIDIFKEHNTLPVTFRTGGEAIGLIDELSGTERRVSPLYKAMSVDLRDEAIRILGPEGFEEFLKAIEKQTKDAPDRQWKPMGKDAHFTSLPDFQSIGMGKQYDIDPGLKTQHPALASEQIRSSSSAFKEKMSSDSGNDILVHKDFSETVGWLLKTHNMYQNTGMWQVARALTSIIKLAKTALNFGNHLTNYLSNHSSLMASEGWDPVTTHLVVFRNASDMYRFANDPGSLSPKARAEIKSLMETGGINQTMLVQEIESVLEVMDGQGRGFHGVIQALVTGRYPSGQLMGAEIRGLKGKAARVVPILSDAYVDAMKRGYRAFGDELYKFTKARLEMEKNEAMLAGMQRGQSVSFFDSSRGQFTTPPLEGNVFKKADGDYLIIKKNGDMIPGDPKALRDLNAHASMNAANTFFYNLGDLGTLFRKGVGAEGILLSPFLSWRIHSLDLPGLKKGMFYRMFIDDEYRATTDPTLAGSLSVDQFFRSSRRALFLAALKEREIDAYDIRRMLPSWMKNAFIRSDLSLLLANNQIPYSGMIEYLSAAADAVMRLDPNRKGDRLFWSKVFPDRNQSAALGDLVNPSILVTMQTVLGKNPRTGKGFETRTDWLNAVVNQVSDGRISVPKRMLDIYLRQEGALTPAELTGYGKKLITERDILDKNQKSFSAMSALLMRRYYHLSPHKVVKILLNYPKAHLQSWKREWMKNYQMKGPLDSRALNRNPIDYLIGKGLSRANAEMEAEQLEEYKLLFGDVAGNMNVKVGDKNKIGGAFVPNMRRILLNMELNMEKSAGREFGKHWRKEASEILTEMSEPQREAEHYYDEQYKKGETP